MTHAHTLTRHRDIQAWVAERRGLPAMSRSPNRFGDWRARLALRFDRPARPAGMPAIDQGRPLLVRNVVYWPQPPRNRPGPPESGLISRRSNTIGVRFSITSAGTPATPLGNPMLFRPSFVGRAPVPPHW